jgi:hypothetical protein
MAVPMLILSQKIDVEELPLTASGREFFQGSQNLVSMPDLLIDYVGPR